MVHGPVRPGPPLSPFTPRAPFAYDPKAASESALSQRPPEGRSISTTGFPLLVEPGKVWLQRAFPDTEYIRPLSAKNLADQPAAVPCAAHDLLDRNPLFGQSENRSVRFLATEVALVLQCLGEGQKGGVESGSSHCGSDLMHGLANRIEEGAARVFHQMPAVGDLDRMRERALGRDR